MKFEIMYFIRIKFVRCFSSAVYDLLRLFSGLLEITLGSRGVFLAAQGLLPGQTRLAEVRFRCA